MQLMVERIKVMMKAGRRGRGGEVGLGNLQQKKKPPAQNIFEGGFEKYHWTETYLLHESGQEPSEADVQSLGSISTLIFAISKD